MSANLPIYSVLPELRYALNCSVRAILEAPPGAGKTTAVPLALLDEPWLEGKKIVMLEPRRIAARNAATRMAQLLGEPLGERVGYRIRGEKKVSKQTRIEVVTEGLLARMLNSDPALETVGLVIFDEFHERSLHADLALALTLQTQSLLRDDLKILVMSATLDAEELEATLEGASVIRSEGRSFPVDIRYLDFKERISEVRDLARLAATKALAALNEHEGSQLVFLPGVREIRETERLIGQGLKAADVDVVPLYGDLDKSAQQAAIAPARPGRRKIVLSTNVAETSLTIEGVSVVIDGGLERVVHYDSDSGMNRFLTLAISEDSATQRAGRAGRTEPGVCYRLWHSQKALRVRRSPEILQSDLAPMMLSLAEWGVQEPEELTWMDLPPGHAVTKALKLLSELEMIDEAGRITEHGQHALTLGVHPRLSHMLLRAAESGWGYEAALCATLLGEKDPFGGGADLRDKVETLHHNLQNCDRRFGHLYQQVRSFLKMTGTSESDEVDRNAVGILVALAYPERIAVLRDKLRGRYLLANGKGVVLRADDSLAGTPMLSVADAGGNSVEATIFRAAPLTQADLETHFSEHIKKQQSVTWSTNEHRVEARETEKLGAITLQSRAVAKPDSEKVMAALLEGVRSEGLGILPWDDKSLTFRHRVNFVNAHRNGTFADMDDDALLQSLETWLAPYAEGITDAKGLASLDLHAMLLGMLPWEEQQALDRLAPERMTVPSGSKIRIDYTDPDQPVLAVRLQEMFGEQQTPSVLDGEVSLMLHLLSPAQRPVQVTKDLVSFWNTGYADVRKELRGKYKKHYWPEDPHEAVATSKTKKYL